jgi:hypothetical protein
MRMKENALRPGVLETYITCLMMACDTNDRAMIESMVKAIVSEYSPQCQPAREQEVALPVLARPHLLKRLTSFRI